MTDSSRSMDPISMRVFRALPSLALMLIGLSCFAKEPDQNAEIAAVHRWAEAKFGGRSESLPPEANILLQLKPNAFARKNIQGHPFLIAGRTFADGVAMRSKGEIQVQVPAGASRFRAVVGVDSNDVGYYSNAGRGSVVASVMAGGTELYRSPVLHEGLAGIPLDLDLQGARQFSIRLEAVGVRPPTYQTEWDQADWADAVLILTDGRLQPLSQLPIGPLPQADSTDAPFSFEFAGKPSSALLPSWKAARVQRRLDKQRTEYTSTYTDPSTALSVRGTAVVYHDFPVVEWTLYFKNSAASPAEILENIKPLDVEFERGSETRIALHHSKGSTSKATDFQPLTEMLAEGDRQHFSSVGGRPTDGDMPYFNLAWLQRGIILALGWPGQWDLEISRDRPQSVRVQGGQSLTHFRLMPGEEVRTPLAVVLFWTGDWIDGQNVWRQWMISHNLPRPGGKLPPPQIAAGSAHFTVEMQEANEENQKRFLSGMLKEGLPIDHWWMDAGWYRYRTNWSKVGTWEIDTDRFPHGLRPITDLGHEHGVKSILWFEPERVSDGTWLATNHPEWLIGPAGKDKLLFLGNKDAWNWLVRKVSALISEQGIDVYRQDFNFAPLTRWQANDTPDRQGISEIKHVEGYLAYFDELKKRFPNLLIDTCASGGRRLDLETLRRAVPLWRSDYPYGAAPMQMQTFGLSLWVPYFGTGGGSLDPYTFRSEMTPATSIGPDPRLQGNLLQVQQNLLSQWRQVAEFYYDDFIPLTEYSDEESTWMAWQLGRSDGRAGIVQVFRRDKSSFVAATFRLRDLNENSTYIFEDLDSHKTTQMAGKDLIERGLPVWIGSTPGAVILRYHENASHNDER
ncbi:MAG TPA: alpha-galactosidase [Bryobacteraceae bacterium]|nr:alpha-galactosidase [Bryobacteraceae bacterium]